MRALLVSSALPIFILKRVLEMSGNCRVAGRGFGTVAVRWSFLFGTWEALILAASLVEKCENSTESALQKTPSI